MYCNKVPTRTDLHGKQVVCLSSFPSVLSWDFGSHLNSCGLDWTNAGSSCMYRYCGGQAGLRINTSLTIHT